MDHTPIAQLHPELPALQSKQLKAVVTLIWPYSSSARQFALLLAEPELRLRRNKGQVRVRFEGSSAKAAATTGIGIGDQVLLGLRGAQFIQESSVNTPGRSIDWELSYSQTLVAQIFRNGTQIANLELEDVAPTPAPRSPVRRLPIEPPSSVSNQQWSSPAFLKRVRLSDGPIFEGGYDPLADEIEEDAHDRKRRRKSYRDWTAWTYSARTPSPEKEDMNMAEDGVDDRSSPIRASQLPETPLSLAKPEAMTKTGALHEHAGTIQSEEIPEEPTHEAQNETKNEETFSAKDQTRDPSVRDADYYDLYAGPDEFPPSDNWHAFGGDTEPNTEEEEEDATHSQQANPDIMVTEIITTLEESHKTVSDLTKVSFNVHESETLVVESGSSTEEDTVAGIIEITDYDGSAENERVDDGDQLSTSAGAAQIVMPPPNLPLLQTNIPVIYSPGMLTPIGQEPSSPTLKPLDSATLPMPSPFPGERDVNITSYLDHIPQTQHATELGLPPPENQVPNEEAVDIGTSFYSPTSASNAPAWHPTHESAFTDLRFTFGLDGVGPSRLEVLQQPTDRVPLDDENVQNFNKNSLTEDLDSMYADAASSEAIDGFQEAEDPLPEQDKPEDLQADPQVIVLESDTESASSQDEAENESESDGEDDEVTQGQQSDDVEMVDPEVPGSDEGVDSDIEEIPDSKEEHSESEGQIPSRQRSAVSAEILDLGSPSLSEDEDSEEEDVTTMARADVTAEEKLEDIEISSLQDPDRRSVSPAQGEMSLAPENSTGAFGDLTATEGVSHDKTPTITLQPAEELISRASPGLEDQTMTDFKHGEPKEPEQISYQKEPDVEDYPDIKMESIEEEVAFPSDDQEAPQNRDNRFGNELVTDTPVAGPSAELLIEVPVVVPEDGHDLGDIETVAVPNTGPARNTRSKTKEATSPAKEEEVQASQRTTRSRKPKPSFPSIARSTISPPHTRARSTTSPAHSAMPTSPYSLRSQSKMQSPTTSVMSAGTATETTSPRTRSTRRHKAASQPSQLNDSEGSHLQRSFASSERDEHMPDSPTIPRSKFPSVHQPLREGNLPVTPDATQQSFQSQPAIRTDQQDKDLPMTPQLTQKSSAGLRASKADDNIEEKVEPAAKSPRITRSTPRRNTTTADVASLEASPSARSDANLSVSEPEATQSDETAPSVGLSTPLAYYTPLKDLVFFLNRSSAFHSSSHPDILALVTSGSTVPKKADKGPKHWNTTLHITDLSKHPGHTVVNVFRAYEKALPVAQKGDIILLRAFAVKSLNRQPALISGDESAWCVWRYGAPDWGAGRAKKRGKFAEIKAREEVNGPEVERGEGEWGEVAKLRAWWASTVEKDVLSREQGMRVTRARDKGKGKEKMDADAEA